jgi:hypothetical protein
MRMLLDKKWPLCRYAGKSLRGYVFILAYGISCLAAVSLQAQVFFDELLFPSQLEINNSDDNYDYLLDLLEHPLNPNTASVDELLRLPGMTYADANRVVTGRLERGPYATTAEVQATLGGGPSFAKRMMQFMRLDRLGGSTDWKIRTRSRLDGLVEKSRGYATGDYPGLRMRRYNRVVFEYGEKLSGALLVEEDAGEVNWRDHVTGYVELRDVLPRHRLVLGRYNVELGQGLVFWRSSMFGKGGDAIAGVRRSARGPVGYRSADELGGFLGAAVDGSGDRWRYTLFASHRRMDGNINDEGAVTSLYRTGFHRTELEQSKDGNLKEQLVGAGLRLQIRDGLTLGGTAAHMRYNRNFVAAERDPWRFAGRENTIISGDIRAQVEPVELFGEAARSSGGLGMLAGIVAGDMSTAFTAVGRRYDKDYYSFYGGAFGDRSENRNEQGLYLGVRRRILQAIEVNAYVDMYRFPARRWTVPLPSKGSEAALLFQYAFSRSHGIDVRMRRRTGDKGFTLPDVGGEKVQTTTGTARNEIRVDWDRTWSRLFRSRWRMEWVRESTAASSRYAEITGTAADGVFGYLETTLRPHSRLIVDGRCALFAARNGKVSFYAYERHMPGMLSSRHLRGDGSRYYVMARVQLSAAVQWAMRYDLTHYRDRSVVGSGRDSVEGKMASHWATQLDVALP